MMYFSPDSCRLYVALDQRFGFAGAAAVLMPVQVQMLAVDRRFGFAGAVAVLMLVQVQVLALDRRFVLRVLLAAVLVLVLDRRFALPVSCHAQNDIMSCPGMTSCHARGDKPIHPPAIWGMPV